MDDTLKKVLIANDEDGLSHHLILKARSMGMTTALEAVRNYRELQHLDIGPRDHVIHVHEPDSKGIQAPVKTQMAVKFPLKSRRERRGIQRQVSKMANKEKSKGEGVGK